MMTDDLKSIERAYSDIMNQFSKVIFGQREVIHLLLVSIFSRGHSLITGVPGLAKTMIINTLARMLDLKFKRVQFTPDLMPSDITGTEILETNRSTGEKFFKLVKGPIFTNILLADEINRATPKTQSALLEAMQEKKVTISGVTYPLEEPFLTFATQNPIEQEGTYPLPEAQIDRFMLSILIDYPDFLDELEVIKVYSRETVPEVSKILSRDELLRCQKIVDDIPVSEHVLRFALKLVRKTRPGEESAPAIVKEHVAYGAGVRAGIFLIHGARANAAFNLKTQVSIDDVIALVMPILRHRIILNYKGVSRGITVNEIIEEIVNELKKE